MAISFVTTSEPITQSTARSVRSMLEASSLSITGFTEPLALALFTSSSLSGNQSNASSSSTSDISSATIMPLSSKETNPSSSLQIISPVTQDVAVSSAGDIIATNTMLSNSTAFLGSSSSNTFNLTFSMSNLLSGHGSNSSSMSSRSNGIASSHFFQSSSRESSASSYFPVRATIMRTVSTVTENFVGTINSTEPTHTKSVGSSLVQYSLTRTSSVVNNSSAYVHQGDSTEMIRSTKHEGSSYISSTMSTLMTTVYGSRASTSNRRATHSLSPSISVSLQNQRISDNSSFDTVVSKSPFEISSRKTLQLNQTMYSTFENSRPSESRQNSESVLFSDRVSVTKTVEQFSTFDSPKQTINVSFVVTSYPTGVLANTSVKSKRHSSTAFIGLETSTKQTSLSQAESTVNNSYMSFSIAAGISNSFQPLPTSKTPLLSNGSLTYSSNSMSSSVLMSTKSLSASLTVPQETSGRSSIVHNSSQSIKTTLHSSQVVPSFSLQSKERNSISTQFTATATQQPPYVSPISSSIMNISLSNSTSNLTRQITAVSRLPSSEYMNISTMGVSLLRASSTLENTTSSTFTSSSFNVTDTTIDSTTQVIVTATIIPSGNSSVADALSPSLKISEFETATSYISSSHSDDKSSATVSDLTPSVLPKSSSYLVSPTYSTGLSLENRTVSSSQPDSVGRSIAPTFIHKPMTSLTSITSVIKTSFSAENITSDVLPTLTLATMTMATSKSDSPASQFVTSTVSRTISYLRNSKHTDSSSANSSSIYIKTVSSFSVVNFASSRSEQNQTHSSSTLQRLSLATFAEPASRTTNHSVSVHERSSHLIEKSSKFQKSETNNLK